MKMNHDYAHCADYKYGVCPTECFRGQLVRDLKDAPDGFAVTFMSFKDSKECMLEEKLRRE